MKYTFTINLEPLVNRVAPLAEPVAAGVFVCVGVVASAALIIAIAVAKTGIVQAMVGDPRQIFDELLWVQQ